MKKLFFALLIVLTIAVLSAVCRPVFAQQPTFGPTCTPSPQPTFGPTCTPSPTLPVTAGSGGLTGLIFVVGAILILGSLGTLLFLPLAKKLE